MAARVATLLAERGHTVEVHTLKHETGLRNSEIMSGVRITRHPFKRKRFLGFTTVTSTRLIAAVSQVEADVVHIHNTTYPLLLLEVAAQLKRNGIPRLIVPHGIHEAIAGGHKGLASFAYKTSIAAILRQLFSNVNAVGLLSRHDLAVLASIGIRSTNHAVLSNGVDIPLLRVPSSEDGSYRLRLLHVANLKPNKGHLHVLRALQLLEPEVPIVYEVVGSGGQTWAAYEREIRHSVAALGLQDRVVLHGRVSDEERDLLYSQADIVMVPSLAETFPLAVLEGMSYAKPVIATRVGGVEDMIEDGRNGITIAPASPKAIVAAIKRLFGRDVRQRIGRSARLRVEREFSWEAVAQRYDVFSEYVSSGCQPTLTAVGEGLATGTYSDHTQTLG